MAGKSIEGADQIYDEKKECDDSKSDSKTELMTIPSENSDCSDKNKSEKKYNFHTSLLKTVINCISSLTNLNIFRNSTRNVLRTPNKITEEAETNRDYKSTTLTNFNHSSLEELSNEEQAGARAALISQSRRNQDIKTLEDALNYFELSNVMEDLEISLEEVRRRRKSKEEHSLFLKNVDKIIQKLSFKYHPDKVLNKGGSEEEIDAAQKLQAAINAVRSALTVLNDAFLEDLDTDHRYGFYTKLELSSLANETEVKSHIYEVVFQIGLLSEIKHQKVIIEIRKFLIESQRCVEMFFDCNINDFEKHRDLALLHLKSCIKGYKQLKSELKTIEKECRVEKLDNISCSINRMIIENQESLELLIDLERVAKKSLGGSFRIFTTSETLDEFFVLPFVCYVNVILMCNVMIRSSAENYALESPHIDPQTLKINGNISFTYLYSLVMYFIDKQQYEWNFKDKMSKQESKEAFKKNLVRRTKHFNDIFKEYDYKDRSMKNYLSEELKKCIKMMFDFKVKEKEMSEKIEKIKKKTEEIDDKYEKTMKENEELNKLIQQQIEKNKKLLQLNFSVLSDKF